MSRSRLMHKLRRQPWYEPLVREMEAAGIENYEFAPPTGRGHPKLIVRHGGREMTTPVPSSTGSESRYLLSRIRRFMECAQTAAGCHRTAVGADG